ncbi:MAG: O-antigen polymerase [Euryarchaeota archaeon]|nr:O-antigen polymerase [Euryarchaeota archaeon]OUX33283.1 MAG: hypothetical protein CBE24_02460 [bacterium TMED264]
MIKENLNKIFNKDFIFFRLGIFFIPSAIALAGFFIIISLISQTLKRRDEFLRDKINIALIFITFLMIISCIIQNLFNKYNTDYEIENYLTWIGLFNWIPFFWVFWSSQAFFKTKNDREIISLILIFSTIPVIISGILQYYFNFVGPFEFLNGLIIWYQRPIDEISGLTGLFNHANYAGAWLSIILPLCLAQSFNNSKKYLKKNVFRTILVGILLCIVLTNSRNAWGSATLTLPVLFGISSIKWFLPLILSISSFIMVVTNNIFKGSIQEFLRNNIPDKIWLEFTDLGFSQLNATRLEILNSALGVIINNPFFGTGAASFPIIYEFETGFWKGHSHNLFTELSISYGLPSTIILISFLGIILLTSFKNLYRKKETNIKDRAFFVAILIFLLSQLVDIQYFDGRVSLVFWLLLAGLKSINDENKLIRYE